MRLADKTILITAAGQGIGRTSALARATSEPRVIATDCDLLQGLHMECHRLDVTDATAVLDPCLIRNAACMVPDRSGGFIGMKPASLQTCCHKG